ncbi:bys1 domain-containing [Pyrenophora seminiperda CCB06]|uniref:Bys1 domain-containing n=1 Tax=Pyrenophora seminiperda CCB06 TaxID=1302712 RepID=A0A3M7LXZ5_9PLEO|nr:bys1 domain-containing [Pyrenophora seminiperda CCB06]
MLSKLSLSVVAMQASLAMAGNAILSNRCSYDVWVWSVSGKSVAPIHVPSRSQHTEPLTNTGTSLKICKSSELAAGKHTQFEYTPANGQMWYDISFVDCAQGKSASDCPGHDEGLTMRGSNSQCGSIDCAAGSYCPKQAYYVPQPLLTLGIEEPVFNCPGTDVDIYMTVCSGQESLKRSVAGRMEVPLAGEA